MRWTKYRAPARRRHPDLPPRRARNPRHRRGAAQAPSRRAAEILPLFARLSAAEQERVFKPGGARRIVLATNVAETSLTVPGIRYVIDPGYARLLRYSYRAKVERLQVEKISQASANQRAGRCGRVMSGVCVRLYAEEDFNTRPAFTDPEIRRSNLAAVILRMKALGLADIEDFPFLEPPDSACHRRRLQAAGRTRRGGRAARADRNRPAARQVPDRPAHRPHDPGGQGRKTA